MGPIEQTIEDFVKSVFDNDSLTSDEKRSIINSVMLNMVPYLTSTQITNAMIGSHIKIARQRRKMNRE